MTFEQCIVAALALCGWAAVLSVLSRMKHYSRMRMSNGETSVSNDARLCAEVMPRWDTAMFDEVAGSFQPERGQFDSRPETKRCTRS